MKKLLVGSMIALVGFATQSFAALQVNDISSTPTGLASYLRGMSQSNWATVKSTGTLNTTWGNFVSTPSYSYTNPEFTIGQGSGHGSLKVEGIFKSASYTDTLNIETPNQMLISNMQVDAGKEIVSLTNSWEGFNLVFTTPTNTKGGAGGTSGMVALPSSNVMTLYTQSGTPKYFLWMLEDTKSSWVNNGQTQYSDNDFNDFIVLGTLSAVPEPSAIISLLAVGFLGLTVFRHRRKSKVVEA